MSSERRELSPENVMNPKVLSTWDCCVGMKLNNSLHLVSSSYLHRPFLAFCMNAFTLLFGFCFVQCIGDLDDVVSCAFKPHFAFSKMEDSQILKVSQPR